ncbi:hypothetical protein BH24CHL8_BH24CHL8_10450 [soil metagenome]
MDIQLAPERIFLLQERLSADEIRQRAMDRRTQAFGGGLGNLLQRPKPEDITLVEAQRRLEPFWHAAARARYVYQRSRDYAVPSSAPEVREVTVNGTTYPVQGSTKAAPTFTLSVTESCLDEFAHQVFSDGVSGAPVADAQAMITGPSSEVTDPATLSADETIVLPPEQRASFVVRKLLGEMMKPVQADSVEEESLVLEKTDLYYRPVYAYDFHWAPKDKRGVVEIDGLTGQVRQGQSLMPRLKRMVSRESLFDIGADTAGLLIPGGSIAVKVARAAVDRNY